MDYILFNFKENVYIKKPQKLKKFKIFKFFFKTFLSKTELVCLMSENNQLA